MALPKIDKPLFEDVLPSNNETVYYRAFTVKEEKILLVGRESDDLEQSMLAMKQVINNCTSYKNGKEFDIGSLPVFDMEYLLLKIRSKSVEDVLVFTITDKETNMPVELSINIDEMTVKRDPKHTNKIKINDEYTLVMKYPTVDMMRLYANDELSDTLKSFTVMVNCLDKLVSEDNIYDFSTETEESIVNFLDDLDPQVLLDIKEFFETAPKMKHEITYTNKNGNEVKFVIEGAETFFE